MRALLRPAFVLGLSIAIAATSLVGSSSVALAATPPRITYWALMEGPVVYEGDRPTVLLAFTDPDNDGLHTVDIFWGNDTADQDRYTLPSGARGTILDPIKLRKTVPYMHDEPDTLTILITINDPVLLNSNSKTLPVTVLNAAPVFTSFDLSPTDVETDQTVTANGVFTDKGGDDTHTLTLNWGDLTETTVSLGAALSFTDAHAYTTAGIFTVTATVRDNADANVATSTVSVHVRPNQAPSIASFEVTVGPEGGTSTLALAFTDVDALDTHTVSVEWGDGVTTNSGDLAPDRKTFGASHVYADTGTYPLLLTLNDSAIPANTATRTWSVSPTNVAPVVGSLSFSPDSVVDHQELTLTGTFRDPGATDTFTLTVNWGDGKSSEQLHDTDGSFAATHSYDAAGSFTITVTVEDRDHAKSSPATLGLDILPSNHAPTGLAFDATATGANVVVTGSFTDPDTTDAHTLTLTWGDGGVPETLDLVAGKTTFTAPHVYVTSKTYTVTATVTDHPAGATTSPVSHDVVVTIAPSALAFEATVTGANVVVTGSFTDPDTTDTHTLTVTWGDGDSERQTLIVGDRTFTSSHVYLQSNTYTVTATVADAAGQTSATKQVPVTVPATSASDLIDEMSSAVRSFDLDRTTERWLLKKLGDLNDSLAYGNGQVCSSSGTLNHVLAFAQRTLTSDQYGTLSALAIQVGDAAGCTTNAAQLPKVQKAATVTTTAVTPALTTTPAQPQAAAPEQQKDAATKDATKTATKTAKSESKATAGRNSN